MKIGLIRHFKVKIKSPGKFLLSADEMTDWFDEYAAAEIIHAAVDMRDEDWQHCFSSPLPRAMETACAIFPGEIVSADVLQELNVLPMLNKKLRLPAAIWGISILIKSTSGNAVTRQFSKNLSAFVDQLLDGYNQPLLVVSHGFVMMYLQKELLRRGFSGERFRLPENGKVYLFEQ